jgi:heat shock protein HspQ
MIYQNTNNNGKSMEWTWEENLLLKYMDEDMIEGQLDKLSDLVPQRSTNEAKEYNQMIEESQFEVPIYFSKNNALIDENKAPLLKNKINKVFHWKKEEHGYIYLFSIALFLLHNYE